jgi:phage I-like protein
MNNILTILKELSGAPAEFQVLPEGKIEINGESPAYLNEEAAKKVIAFFKARGNDMVIDYEHQTLTDGQAPAAGWVKNLLWKGKDGLWAVVEWTKKAKDYLENREYRYFSPVMFVSASDRLVTALVNIALTNTPAINNLTPIIAKMTLDEARAAQDARSGKWEIAIKDGGHVTKPGQWADVPDEDFLDPVNYRYPCPDAAQTRAAAAYWGQTGNQEQYTADERALIETRLDKFRKKFNIGVTVTGKEKTQMIEKVKQLLGLAVDAAEVEIEKAVTLLVNKAKDLETQVASLVACKEVLEALGAKADAGKEEVIRIVGSLKAPADVAKTLSLEVASLKTKIAGMEQQDLVAIALKEGKTSPEELDKWGRDLALKAPEQFRTIVLSRPAGSVIPVDKIVVAKDPAGEVPDDLQKSVNRMMGVSEETFKKYNK